MSLSQAHLNMILHFCQNNSADRHHRQRAAQKRIPQTEALGLHSLTSYGHVPTEEDSAGATQGSKGQIL